jgi:hypothetical protein
MTACAQQMNESRLAQEESPTVLLANPSLALTPARNRARTVKRNTSLRYSEIAHLVLAGNTVSGNALASAEDIGSRHPGLTRVVDVNVRYHCPHGLASP